MHIILGIFAIAATALVGCGDGTSSTGGSGGSAGDGGMGGDGGSSGAGGGDGMVWPCTEAGIRDAIAAGGGRVTGPPP
ncbi:MAG: hypothetical protein AAF997_20770 [Myxococcota bacterium]